jgi:hypothetical protein
LGGRVDVGIRDAETDEEAEVFKFLGGLFTRTVEVEAAKDFAVTPHVVGVELLDDGDFVRLLFAFVCRAAFGVIVVELDYVLVATIACESELFDVN